MDFNRRKILALTGFGALAGAVCLVRNIFLRNRVKDFAKYVFYYLRTIYNFPTAGPKVSLEMALNSRCTSDYDCNERNFHWGLFDRRTRLSNEQVDKVISLVRIPRFTRENVRLRNQRNIITFTVPRKTPHPLRDRVMVESGMQQQAVALTCAALGIGMVFRNLGKDGRPLSDTEHGTIRIKLDPVKPSYSGEYWTRSAPAGPSPWVRGNLPEPRRDSATPLVTLLSNLRIRHNTSRVATSQSLSQLLWAARGRTPHFYKSKPWGMTIPTWAGKQDISDVHVIGDNGLSKYINWERNRPTHILRLLTEIDGYQCRSLLKSFNAKSSLIVLGKNEDSARALWEIGYQLFNTILQSLALGISYNAILLEKHQKTIITKLGVKGPVAVLAL
jgi:hypothetical protein